MPVLGLSYGGKKIRRRERPHLAAPAAKGAGPGSVLKNKPCVNPSSVSCGGLLKLRLAETPSNDLFLAAFDRKTSLAPI